MLPCARVLDCRRHREGFTLIELMIVVFVIAVILAIIIPSFLHTRIAANENSAAASLRSVVTAESAWRQNDTDRNTINDFWTADMSGMYRTEVAPAGSGVSVALLDPAIAQADDAKAAGGAAVAGAAVPGTGSSAANLLPLIRSFPHSGYYYRVMTLDANGTPYAQDPDNNGQAFTSTSAFAFQARPEYYGSNGIRTLITNEAGVGYAFDFGNSLAANADQWPAANPASVGWRPVQ